MSTLDLLALLYFIIGFCVMAIPVFDPKFGKNYDKLDTGTFMLGSLIVWLFWPLIIWFAAKSASDSVRRKK